MIITTCTYYPPYRSNLTYKKETFVLSRGSVLGLQKMAELSSHEQIEYAGFIDFSFTNGKMIFSDLTAVTSNHRAKVAIEEINSVWPALITYHTHPTAQTIQDSLWENEIVASLPSKQDFIAFIKGYPMMQVNIICDLYGYYVIDLVDSMDDYKMPLPHMVDIAMENFRLTPDVEEFYKNESGYEYFRTTLKKWKHLINNVLAADIYKQFKIRISYHGYDAIDDPVVTMDRRHFLWQNLQKNMSRAKQKKEDDRNDLIER